MSIALRGTISTANIQSTRTEGHRGDGDPDRQECPEIQYPGRDNQRESRPLVRRKRDAEKREHHASEEYRHQEGNRKRDERTDEFPGDERMPGERIGERQPHRPPFLLAADRVVGEQNGEEGEDGLENEFQIEEPEHGKHRLLAVARVILRQFAAAMHLRRPADVV
jgi:hypothetical protein